MTHERSGHGRGERRELLLTAAMLLITLFATTFLVRDIIAAATAPGESTGTLIRLLLFATVVGALIYGNIIFQASRLGHSIRRLRHQPPGFEQIVDERWAQAKSVAILVPSYKEDTRTIRQTLLTAALQHYPNKRVVLLLDDPPQPQDAASDRLLANALAVPGQIELMLQEPRQIVIRARAETADAEPGYVALPRLLGAYRDLVRWFDRAAAGEEVADHIDAHFVRVAYTAHRHLLEQRARELVHHLVDPKAFGASAIAAEYARLERVFATEITIFQRKRYRNMSHEANKAANLNAYIALLGKSIIEESRTDGVHLIESDAPGCRIVPDATYVLTLDADSLLLPDYALRLAAVFEEPGNERVAVVQTPYSAVPNPPGVLERIAGATTDVQYVIHQGFTFWGATFWVGANALLRKRALEDIRTDAAERGFVVPRYIQDRTVIEDTESTIDLARAGWGLLNYPDRLAFSATPPDFGSLLIQRARWANGGLLILPKALRQLFADRLRPDALVAFLVRFHYLTSIATGSIGLLVLLFLPLETEFNSPWLPLTALPYFLLYWRELVRIGYRKADMLRVYAFNLLLIPINLAGVLKSLQQGMTGARVPFARTPKVAGRTAAPAWAVYALWTLFAWCLVAVVFDAMAHRWMHALFAAGTGTALGYAIRTFVGVRESWEDSGLSQVLSVSPRSGRGGALGALRQEPVSRDR